MSELPQVIRWENPPASKTPGRTDPRSRFARIADQLRDRPGHWAVVFEGGRGPAAGLASSIRGGKTQCFAPSGDFDSCTRIRDGVGVVYARYLGDGEKP